MSITTKQGDDGNWIATDIDQPGVIGHGRTEVEARQVLQCDEGLRDLALRNLPRAPGPLPPDAVVLFGKVYDALLASGWTVTATTFPNGVQGSIVAILKKGGATFMAEGSRDQLVSPAWLAAIVAATGLDPSTIG